MEGKYITEGEFMNKMRLASTLGIVKFWTKIATRPDAEIRAWGSAVVRVLISMEDRAEFMKVVHDADKASGEVTDLSALFGGGNNAGQ